MKDFFLYLSIILFFSCISEKEDDYLASYKDSNLTIEEVLSHKPESTDSADFVSQYIDKWLHSRVVLDKANIYIDEELEEIISLVNDYKETLIIESYRRELINSQFDTTVNKTDIEKYYNDYLSDFILNKDIIKARIIVLEKETLKRKETEILIRSHDKKSEVELNSFCEMYAVKSFLDDSVWVYFSEFYQKIPISENEKRRILSNKNKLHSFTDENYIYLLFVRDYQIKGSKSPLSFEFNNIRKLIRDKNKIKFITNMENRFYNDAISSEYIKIYK